jgi:hypothetical protein
MIINRAPLKQNDPWVTFCGWCGRRIEVCQATRRDPAVCNTKAAPCRDRPPTR